MLWGVPWELFWYRSLQKKVLRAKKCKMVPKRVTQRITYWNLWVLKTREQTAPDLRRSEKSRGVARTRFSCLKARWRICVGLQASGPPPRVGSDSPRELASRPAGWPGFNIMVLSATVPSGTRSVSDPPLLLSQIFSDLELSVLLF